jgi:hypothetical protein
MRRTTSAAYRHGALRGGGVACLVGRLYRDHRPGSLTRLQETTESLLLCCRAVERELRELRDRIRDDVHDLSESRWRERTRLPPPAATDDEIDFAPERKSLSRYRVL